VTPDGRILTLAEDVRERDAFTAFRHAREYYAMAGLLRGKARRWVVDGLALGSLSECIRYADDPRQNPPGAPGLAFQFRPGDGGLWDLGSVASRA